MAYYEPCEELDECNRLIEVYYNQKKYKECFDGHLSLAQKGYPLAECQVGWFYYEGLGVEKDLEKAFYWTKRAAKHGDRDAQCNLGDLFYLEGTVVAKDMEEAKKWLLKAAAQENEYAIQRCRELGFSMDKTLRECQEMYRGIANRFSKIELQEWKAEGAMIELAKQVGDLAKQVMVKEKYYALTGETPDIDEKLGNEMADVIAQVMRLADYYKIDLTDAFIKAREDENQYLISRGV